MKSIIYITLSALLYTGAIGFGQKGLISTGGQSAFAQTKKGPGVKFDKDVYDFGKVEKGQIAKYKFKFTNTGNEPLVLTSVRASCGCTTPTWSKEPVMPGESGYVEAAYNSNVGHGTFTKSITVQSNVKDQTQVLYIKGEVIPDPNDDPARKTPLRTGNE